MLQKFKITSYAFIVVFMTVQVFTIPAFGLHGPPHTKTLPTIGVQSITLIIEKLYFKQIEMLIGRFI